MLEVTPPARRTSAEYLSKVTTNISELIDQVNCVDFINIPEIIEENRTGMPLYKNLDPRIFGSILYEKTRKEIIVNKVTVHLKSLTDLNSWLKDAIGIYKLRHLVFVGGNSSAISYNGPGVIDANSLAKNLGFIVGNIAIPDRKNEFEKLIVKTSNNCSFFTTQIILQTEKIKQTLKIYDFLCKSLRIKPAVFFLSFAPVYDEQDLYLLKWLGAHVPEAIESRLRNSSNIGYASIELAKELFSDIVSFVLENNISVPISLNVESVSYHNLPLVKEIIMQGKEVLERLNKNQSKPLQSF